MKIDVIICAYNAHKYIKKALDSIVNQTIIDKIDITIIDDGSTYGYEDIIKCFNKKINLITLKNNKGIGLARKEALDKTNNEYIMFIDCDDEFYDNKVVEKLYNIIEEDKKVDVVEGKLLLDNKIVENPVVFLPGKIYRRKFINNNDITFLNLQYAEDSAFNLAIYASGANIKKIDDIIYNACNVNENSITHIYNNSVNLLESIIKACDYAYKKVKDYNVFIKSITNIYEGFITNYLKKNNFKNEDDLINYARICKKFYKKYKKYIIDTDYIKMYNNIFDVF